MKTGGVLGLLAANLRFLALLSFVSKSAFSISNSLFHVSLQYLQAGHHRICSSEPTLPERYASPWCTLVWRAFWVFLLSHPVTDYTCPRQALASLLSVMKSSIPYTFDRDFPFLKTKPSSANFLPSQVGLHALAASSGLVSSCTCQLQLRSHAFEIQWVDGGQTYRRKINSHILQVFTDFSVLRTLYVLNMNDNRL